MGGKKKPFPKKNVKKAMAPRPPKKDKPKKSKTVYC